MLDKTLFFPKVLQAVPADDYKVHAYMNDGSIHAVDIEPLIKPGTVFEPLKDLDVFKSKLTVINDTVGWDMEGNRDPYKCLDIDPFTVFESPVVSESLIF
jgi:hypothetical protein